MVKHLIIDAFLIAKKELKQLWRDKASLVFTILIPIAIMMSFTLAVPQSKSSVNLNIYVYDADNTQLSSKIIKAINNTNLNIIGYAHSEEELQNMLEKGEIAAAIVIPENFTHHVETLNEPSIKIMVDNSKQQVLQTVEGSILDALNEVKDAFRDTIRDTLITNITDLNNAIQALKNNITFAAFFDYGIPSIYAWGNASISVYGWQKYYTDNASAVSGGTITIYDVNSYANTSTLLYLTNTLTPTYPPDTVQFMIGYHQAIYIAWNATFPNPNPTTSEVYAITVTERLNNTINTVLPTYLNATLNETQREIFLICHSNLTLNNWNTTEAIKQLTINMTHQENTYIDENLISRVYDLGENPSQSKIQELATSITDQYINSNNEVLQVNKNLLAGDLRNGIAQSIIVMGIALIFSCFDDIAGAMAREREKGTLHRLYLTPMNRFSFFAGKTISSIILTLIRTTALLGIYLYVFNGIILGSILLVYLISILIAVVTISLGFLISSRNISSRGVVIIQIAIMVPLIFFTGLVVPKELMPPFARMIVNYIPYWYANDALRRVALLGQGIEYIYFDIIMLLASSLTMFILSAIMLKRKI